MTFKQESLTSNSFLEVIRLFSFFTKYYSWMTKDKSQIMLKNGNVYLSIGMEMSLELLYEHCMNISISNQITVDLKGHFSLDPRIGNKYIYPRDAYRIAQMIISLLLFFLYYYSNPVIREIFI